MNICYQCGQPMVTEKYYHEHKDTFATPPKFNHDEHILHNALHGRLTSFYILCKQCGSDYGGKIDADFVSLFRIITETVKYILITKDHGKLSANTLKGYLFEKGNRDKKRDVLIRDNQVTPVVPFYEHDVASGTVTLFANAARVKHFKKVVEKELQQKGFDAATLVWKTVTDMSDMGELGIYFTEGVENFHDKFTMGICKIAVGFATHHGIPRDQLPKVLKIDSDGKGQLTNKLNTITFVPIGVLDMQLELNRPFLERYYPSHTLILFSQASSDGRKRLFCYVDLFSTFQFYVLLNDHYKGDDVYETYHQAIAKEEKEPINVRQYRQKHLSIIADEYQVDMSRYKTSGYTDIYDFLQAEVDKYGFKPSLSLIRQVYDWLETLQHSYNVSQAEGLIHTPVIENLRTMNKSMRLSFLMELRHYFSGEYKDISAYRKNFWEDDGYGGVEVLSTPQECLHETMTHEMRREYCTLKFEQLSDWIFRNMRLMVPKVAP
jgi:hypothetical protein